MDVPVENLPPTLKDVPRDVTLRGTVGGQNPDGTTRINTPRGPVDVPLPAPVPARGTEVAVEIAAGTPPRSATVTLPAQTPAPQTPPATQSPLPQAPVPPQAGPSAPATPIPGQPGATPPAVPGSVNQPPGTPLPPGSPTGAPQYPSQSPSLPAAATPGGLPGIPVPGDAPAPQPQQALPSAVVLLQQATQQTGGDGMTPQNLLGFLKISLQAFMKTPALPQQATGNTLGLGMDQPNLATTAQRPLQIGQMLRLTPLPVGQNAVPLSTSPGMNAPSNLSAPLLPQPASAGQPPFQTINTDAPVTGQIAPQAGIPAILRNMLPPQVALQTLAPAPGTQPQTIVPGITVTGQMITPLPGLSLPQGATPAAQQFIIGTAPDHAPHLITPQNLDVRVAAIMPSASAQVLQNPATANLLHGAPSTPVIFAQVTGQTIQGLPIVQLPTFTLAPDGTARATPMPMILQFPARGLAPATVLKLDILPGMPFSTPAAIPGASFTSLDDLLHGLALDPQGVNTTHMNPVQLALPKPGAAAFTGPVLLFVAALRGGDITSWLGEKGIELVRGSKRADALSRLAGDFASAVRTFREEEARPPGEWKSLNLPMLYGGEISRLQMHYKSFDQQGEGTGEKEKKSGTRFVMDVSLTRMGDMQIDGFSLGKKMDVTLRSEQTLSAAMRETMRKRYFDAISGIGFSGELNFSADPARKNWVNIDDHRGVKAATLA